MDFEYSPRVRELQARLLKFFDQHIYPNEKAYEAEVAANRRNGDAFVPTKVIEDLKVEAVAAGLWNLFLPHSSRVPDGLSNLEYAPLCEIMGRSLLAPAGTPKDITARLQREIAAAMQAPELVRQMADAGIEVRLSSPQEFAALIRADMAKWAAVVKSADVKLD